MYIICSAWFLDIRVADCSHRSYFTVSPLCVPHPSSLSHVNAFCLIHCIVLSVHVLALWLFVHML